MIKRPLFLTWYFLCTKHFFCIFSTQGFLSAFMFDTFFLSPFDLLTHSSFIPLPFIHPFRLMIRAQEFPSARQFVEVVEKEVLPVRRVGGAWAVRGWGGVGGGVQPLHKAMAGNDSNPFHLPFVQNTFLTPFYTYRCF